VKSLKAVEVGCKPGSVACESALTFPSAQVHGVNLSNLPKEYAVKNSTAKFTQDDFMKLIGPDGDSRLTPGTLDYAFLRLPVYNIPKKVGLTK
jgi:hypothetical protein